MDISQEDTILAIGCDNTRVELIDLQKAKSDMDETAMESSNSRYLMASYRTKQSTVFCLKFTYENLLLAVSLFSTDNK